jgi:uncharacterized protein DUF4236
MAFYFRKSLNFGGLRLNLSKSGVGFSAGFKGFRVGTGPRGNYIHAGPGGVYYRQTRSGSKERRQPQEPAPLPPSSATPRSTPVADMEVIDSADIAQIEDVRFQEVIADIGEKAARRRLTKPSLWIWGGVAIVASGRGNPGVGTLFLLLAPIVWAVMRVIDRRRKTVVLFYDLEEAAEQWCRKLCDACEALGRAGAFWHVPSAGASRDTKYTAGAGTVVARTRVRPSVTSLDGFVSNIPLPSIPAGKETLIFLPEVVLVVTDKGAGAVGYDELKVDAATTKFVESQVVPRDARVVDRTWQYVNKRGGPDQRFKDNREIPVAEYGALSFTSQSGLNERFLVSNVDAATQLQTVIQDYWLAHAHLKANTAPA